MNGFGAFTWKKWEANNLAFQGNLIPKDETESSCVLASLEIRIPNNKNSDNELHILINYIIHWCPNIYF